MFEARMAERLRRATQVRVEQSAWVRFPLLALGFVFTRVQEDQRSFWVSAHQKREPR